MLATKQRTIDRVACPICGVVALPAEHVDTAVYFGCPVCDTLFQHPMPTIDQIRTYLDAQYSSGVYNDYVAAAKLKSLTFRSRVDAIHRRVGAGKLLDVGASCGYFVEAAVAAGFDAYGVEISAEAISKAPDDVRARLILGDVNATNLAEHGRFDVVTAFDVIEHVFDPTAFLRQLRQIVLPGGWIVITTPDVHHFLRYVLRSRWPMFQPMQHTVLFSRRGLRLALSAAGYDDILITPAHKTLTADYLAGQVQMYLPAAVSLYRVASRIIPEKVRSHPLDLNIGEIMAFARFRNE